METNGSRSLLVIGAPEHDATAYHLSGFLAPDPVICIRKGGASGKKYLAVSSLEYGRAEKEAPVDELLSFEELGVTELARELKGKRSALAAATAGLLDRLGIASVSVPPNLAVFHADELRARGIEVLPQARLFADRRRVKTEVEISHIERAQRAVEEVCAHAARILEESEVAGDGTLRWRGEALTSEVLRAGIDVELLRLGCVAEGTITAGGVQAADPHNRGSGPLRANEAIIVDIFPMDQSSRYYADMTRTFIKGEPSDELRRMYDTVLESQETALGMIRSGVNGKDVHEKVSEILHAAGYKTSVHDQEEGKPLTEGFFHGTGHGVGLEVHEGPRISVVHEELKAGDVVTVEPGLYYPKIGGVRIEDLVVVTEDGCRNLTNSPKKFVL